MSIDHSLLTMLTLLHWSMLLFLCPYHAVFVTLSLNSGNLMPLALFFLLTIVLALWGTLGFSENFKIDFSISVKKWYSNFFLHFY
jgi:hypothetical protein